jgi:multidrug efflux pump
MTTVPLAIAGALIGLTVSGSTINIISQIGVIMLIGLAAKNGILIVEFSNQLRDRGVEFKEAVIQASMIRLRPVLMTASAPPLAPYRYWLPPAQGRSRGGRSARSCFSA